MNDLQHRSKKNTNGRVFMAALLWAGFALGIQAQTQWDQDGIFFTQSNASQIHLASVPDGHGGVYIVYENSPGSDADIVAQWIDASGTKRWGTSGVTVTSAIQDQKYPAISTDGFGGIYVAWQDDYLKDLYVQHINASGTRLLDPNGMAVCTAANEQTSVKMVTDGGTGAILVWADKRNGSTTDLYAQKINENGLSQWAANGVPVTTAAGNQSGHALLPDGSGGIFAVWQDYRNGFSNIDVYAQRLNASGAQLWITNGVPVSSAANNQLSPGAVISGTKLFVGWEDSRTGTSDVYAQALDFNGSPQWTGDGVAVCSAAGSQSGCRVVEDGSGGAIVTWGDNRTGWDIYAQRMNAGGIAQWSANGIAVNASPNTQSGPEMVADGAGGAEIVWMDYRNGSNFDLYAQHLNTSGSLLRSADGLPISVKPQPQQYPVAVTDGSGGALVFWQDSRDLRSDVYGQLINDNIKTTAPAAGSLWAGDRSQTIQWTFRTTQTRYHHLAIKASQTPGDGFPISIAPNVPPAQTSQSWTAGSVNSSTVQIKIQAFNDENLLLGEYFSPLFTVDSNTPNAFNLISPVNGTTTDLKPTFQWQATTDALSGLDHYELYINFILVQDNLTATAYTLTDAQKLPVGPYTWTVKAVDKAGLVWQANQSPSCIASDDQTPPDVFHLLSPANDSWTQSATPTLTWQATADPGKGLSKYQLYVDGNLAQDNINPSTTSVGAPVLSAGTHSWYVVAVDLATNTRQSAETWTVKVDNQAPAAFALNLPADNVWLKNTKPTFSWTASSDAGSGLAGYRLYVDGVLKLDNLPPGSTGVTLPDAQALAEGTHTWAVTAKDVAGNTRSSTTFTVKIDITPPQNFGLTAPANGGYATQGSPTFSWQTAADPVSGIKEYQLWFDGNLNKQGIASTSATPASPLAEGTHTWTVKAVDQLDNTTTAPSFTFTADWTPPNAFNLIYPAAGNLLHTNVPKFTWRKTSDAVSGFDKFDLYVDGILKKGNLAAGDTAATLAETLANGNHVWKTIAYDKAGNARTSQEFAFNVQCNPPVINSPSSATATEHVPFTYTATASDLDSDPVTITFQNLSSWLRVSGSTVRGTPNQGVLNGSFTVVANDGLFSVTKTVSIAVTPVNDPPVITSPKTASATEHLPFTYTAAAVDSENAPVAFTFKNYPSWLTASGYKISGTPREGDKNSTFDVVASDGSLKDSVRVTLSLTPVNDPPVFTSSSHLYATEHAEFAYTAKATDPEGSTIFYTFKNVPFWMSASGSTIGGIPTNGTPIDNAFDIIASDGSLTDTLHVTVTVNPVNDPPQITSPSTATAIEGKAFSYTAVAFDPEGSALTFVYSNYPSWLSPSGKTIAGTPGEGVPGTTFDVTVNDGELSTTCKVTLTVTAVNDPPVITSAAIADGIEHALFTYTAQASDPENNPLTYTFQNVPAWLHVSGKTVSGTPKEGVLNGTFTFSVTDGEFTRSQTVAITIIPVNDPPAITSPETAAATEHIQFTYTTTAFDSEGDPLAYSFQNLSSWLLPSGNKISGTPGEGVSNGSFDVFVSDGKLSATKHVTITVTPVNDPPVFTSPNSASGTEHVLFSYTASANDPEGNPLTYTYQNVPAWLKPDGNKISGAPGEGILTASFDVTAFDGALSSTLHVTVSVAPVNDPPRITSPDKVSATEHILFSYTTTATDPEGSALAYVFKNYPSWLTPGTNSIGGTPGEGILNGSFDVIASDGSLTDTLRVSIGVTPVNDAPVFTSPNVAAGTERMLFSYPAAAADPEGSAVTYVFKNYPSWLATNGSTISGIPGEGILSGSFDVVASDGSLTTTLRVTVTVTPVNDPPAVTSPRTASATEHLAFSYTAAASDPENDPITFTFKNYPDWLKWTGNKIGGTPGEGDKNATFDVVASDGSLKDSICVALTVNGVDDPPCFTSKDTASAMEHKPFAYTADARDPEGKTVTYAFKKVPSWLSVSGNRISGTPEEANHDTTFAVVASDGSLRDTLVVRVKVKEVNDPPRVTSSAVAEAKERAAFSYTATMFDSDGPRFSIRFIDFPDWLTPVGPIINGTPPHGIKNAVFKIIAWDGILSDTLSVNLTVVTVNNPPRFVMDLPNPVFTPREQLRWQLNLDDYVEDPDNLDSSLTWTCTVLDTQRISVSIHPKTHNTTIVGFNVQKDFRIAFTVSDPSKATATDTMNIAIRRSADVAARISENTPLDFMLAGNYPNPFNPLTVIRYGIPKTALVRLEIYDATGRKVTELVNEKQSAGFYEIQWNAIPCPSGIYLCRIQADTWQKTKKLSLVK